MKQHFYFWLYIIEIEIKEYFCLVSFASFFYIHNLSIHICLLIEKDKKDKSTIWYQGMVAWGCIPQTKFSIERFDI